MPKQAFAVWVTGLPASGKSTLTVALKDLLAERGIDVAVLESDDLRRVLTPDPRYDEQERERFYRQMLYIGRLLVEHGVPVIFDATANRRIWRDRARTAIPSFIEVYVDTNLDTCMARDPKGVYRQGQTGASSTVPGLQVEFEAPRQPEVTVREGSDASASAHSVIDALVLKGYIAGAKKQALKKRGAKG